LTVLDSDMVKVLREAAITTRTARAKLPEGMHWRSIDPDIHLGYRRGVRGGRWVVRWFIGGDGFPYRQGTIGTADDAVEADNVNTFSFNQAVSKAKQFVEKRRSDDLAVAAGPALCVRDAVEGYIKTREAREKAQKGDDASLTRDTRSRLTKHVLADEIAGKPLHSLTEGALEQWRDGLSEDIAPATVRRLVNDFKAALNSAARTNRARLPAELPAIIKNGLASTGAVSSVGRAGQILPDADIRRIIQAA
jgi:hypothetical protein